MVHARACGCSHIRKPLVRMHTHDLLPAWLSSICFFFSHIPTLLAIEGLFSDTLVLCVHYHRFARELSYFWNIPGSFRGGGVGTGIWAHRSRYSMLQRQALKRPLPSWGWIFGRKLSVCLHIALSFPLLFFLVSREGSSCKHMRSHVTAARSPKSKKDKRVTSGLHTLR